MSNLKSILAQLIKYFLAVLAYLKKNTKLSYAIAGVFLLMLILLLLAFFGSYVFVIKLILIFITAVMVGLSIYSRKSILVLFKGLYNSMKENKYFLKTFKVVYQLGHYFKCYIVKNVKARKSGLSRYLVVGQNQHGKKTLLTNFGMTKLSLCEATEFFIDEKPISQKNKQQYFRYNKSLFIIPESIETDRGIASDKSSWISLLKGLRKTRLTEPLNGIIITLGLSDILSYSEQDKINLIDNVVLRVKQVYSKLGYLTPIYFVFTKVDLLQGFDVFFKNISLDEQQQVLGIDLSKYQYHKNKADYIEQQINELIAKLSKLAMTKLAIEPLIKTKQDIYLFPQRFHDALITINDYIKQIAERLSQPEPQTMIGIFFSASLAKQNNALSKQYFSYDFFNELLPKYQKASIKNQHTIARLKKIKLIMIAVLSFGLIFYGIFSYKSLRLNTELLEVGHVKLMQISKELSKPLSSTRHIDILKHSSDYYYKLSNYRNNTAWYHQLGLYRGDVLQSGFKRILDNNWQYTMLSPIEKSLINELEQQHQLWLKANTDQKIILRGKYYALLKTYLMLTNRQYLDINFAKQIILPIWYHHVFTTNKENFPGGYNKEYQGLLSYYLAKLKKEGNAKNNFKPNNVLINKARKDLYDIDNAKNLYALIHLKGVALFNKISVDELLKDYGWQTLAAKQKLSKFYTIESWQKYVKPQIELAAQNATATDWVLFEYKPNSKVANTLKQDDILRLKNKMFYLYYSDYAKAWFRFYCAIQVKTFSSVEEAINQYQKLKYQNNFLSKLTTAIAKEISLVNDSEFAGAPYDSQIIFKALLGLSQIKEEKFVDYFKALASIQEELEQLANGAIDSISYGKKVFALDGSTELQKSLKAVDNILTDVESGLTRQLLHSLLRSPIKEAWRVSLLKAYTHLNTQWQEDVYKSYQKNIKAKFPFTVEAKDAQEIDVRDFYNREDGILWNFYNKNLSSFIEFKRGAYTVKQWLDIGMAFDKNFLSSLTFANQLTQGLFKGSNLGFNFYVYPIPSYGLKGILFSNNQQYLNYKNGPQEWQRLSWAGDNLNDGAMLRLLPAKKQPEVTLEYNGTWAIFHLLAKAQLTIINERTFKANWAVKDKFNHYYRVAMNFKGEAHNNTLQLLLFKHKDLTKTL